MAREPDPIAVELAQLRLKQGLTQAQVYARMNPYAAASNQSIVSELESGRRSPTLVTLRSWSDALGCELVLREVA